MVPDLVGSYISFTSDNLLEISQRNNPQYLYLLEEDARESLKRIKIYLKGHPNEAIEILSEWMEKHEHFPPLELISWFHKENILLATTYFYMNRDYCDYFYKTFEEVYSQNFEYAEEQISIMISTVAAALINTLKHPNYDLQLFIEEVVDNITVKITEMLENNCLKKSPVVDVKKYSVINEPCLEYFACLHLRYLLSESSEYPLGSIVETHTKQWTSAFLPTTTKQHIIEVLSLIPGQKIIDEINERVSDGKFNWKYLFIVTSCLVRSNVEGATLLKDEVDSWLRQSLEQDNLTSLYLPVLVARHCCYEKARFFQSYANWFSSLNFKNSKSFSLFFKFLTEILPYEPPLYLKIHLNKVPSATHGCQNLLVDYIVLAKTRLKDLNESVEYIGLFSDYHETDEEGQQADVARVIAHYVENKEIAKPLLEAYVLRRQYYEKVFLKQLLKVPERDDPSRAEVIHKLNSMGKLPSTLFNTWTKL